MSFLNWSSDNRRNRGLVFLRELVLGMVGWFIWVRRRYKCIRNNLILSVPKLYFPTFLIKLDGAFAGNKHTALNILHFPDYKLIFFHILEKDQSIIWTINTKSIIWTLPPQCDNILQLKRYNKYLYNWPLNSVALGVLIPTQSKIYT